MLKMACTMKLRLIWRNFYWSDMKTYKKGKYINKIFETEGEYAEWCGYYNYDFLSADKKKLL